MNATLEYEERAENGLEFGTDNHIEETFMKCIKSRFDITNRGCMIESQRATWVLSHS